MSASRSERRQSRDVQSLCSHVGASVCLLFLRELVAASSAESCLLGRVCLRRLLEHALHLAADLRVAAVRVLGAFAFSFVPSSATSPTESRPASAHRRKTSVKTPASACPWRCRKRAIVEWSGQALAVMTRKATLEVRSNPPFQGSIRRPPIPNSLRPTGTARSTPEVFFSPPHSVRFAADRAASLRSGRSSLTSGCATFAQAAAPARMTKRPAGLFVSTEGGHPGAAPQRR